MKFLRRFCSEQVQILLERMDDHWVEEFAIDGSKWDPMLPYGKAYDQFTKIEQRCIRNTAQEQTTKWEKERAYTGILERTMSPTKTRWEFDDERHGRRKGPSQVLTAAAIKQQTLGVLHQEFDKAYRGTLQEHAQIHNQKAEQIQKHMQNVQFELRHANNVQEMEALMQKQRFLIEHERHIIEHQQFLKQHAPRGYI